MHLRQTLVGAVVATFSLAAVAADQAALTAEARAITKEFGGTLINMVKASVKSNGPAATIPICNHSGPGVAKKMSEIHQWDVSRTSLKIRNPANTPDEWETAVLHKFEERQAAGEDPKKMDHAEVVDMDGKQVFRYMKAIPIQEPCLQCHGEAEVTADVVSRLQSMYPDDKARGYRMGDIRGAFTLMKDL